MTVLGETCVADRRPLAPDLEPDEERLRRDDRAFDEEAGLRTRTDLELDLAERNASERAKIAVLADVA
jgi:hypothetical protein